MTIANRTGSKLIRDWRHDRGRTKTTQQPQKKQRDAPQLKPPLKAVVGGDDIKAGESGDVAIWKRGGETERTVEAHLNWMHGDQQISAGKQVVIQWFADEAKWIILHAECE